MKKGYFVTVPENQIKEEPKDKPLEIGDIVQQVCVGCETQQNMRFNGDMLSSLDFEEYPTLKVWKDHGLYTCLNCDSTFTYKNGDRK